MIGNLKVWAEPGGEMLPATVLICHPDDATMALEYGIPVLTDIWCLRGEAHAVRGDLGREILDGCPGCRVYPAAREPERVPFWVHDQRGVE